MGRKFDPTTKVKRGPGRKARKQKGAETELAKILVDGNIIKSLIYMYILCPVVENSHKDFSATAHLNRERQPGAI